MNDRVGEQIGNYRLVELLGTGGFAEVYLGKQVFLDSPAAIKVLRTSLQAEDREKFRDEARTLVQLIHPHIIRILDFGLEANTPFLVMDYAPHGTMRTRYPRGQQLALTLVVDHVKQVASALQYAHDDKIIHRDIKPENMLVGRQQEILLSDFGIAVVAHNTSSAHTQDLTGTVAYMAPEHIHGHARPASDQYSLAVVAYEWLSGNPPFDGSFTEIAFKQVMAVPPRLRQTLPDLPTNVEQVIMTALAKEPNQRYESVSAFASALEQASQHPQMVFTAPVPNPRTPLPPSWQMDPGQPAALSELPTSLLADSSSPTVISSSAPVAPISENVLPTVVKTPGPVTPVLPLLGGIPPLPEHQAQAAVPWHPASVRTDPPMAFPVTPVPPVPAPAPVAPEARPVSRRGVLIAGLTTVGILAAGGLSWEVLAHRGTPSSLAQTTGVKATATAHPSPTTVQATPTPNLLLAMDTFQRPNQTYWGKASDGLVWSGDAASSSDFSIFNQTGQVQRTASGESLYTAILGNAPDDAEVLVTAMLSSLNNSHIGAMLRYQNNEHYYKVILDGNGLHFLKRISVQSGPTLGQTLAYPTQPNTLYTVRFRVYGTQLLARAWSANDDEPQDWMISATDDDATFSTGTGGLRPQVNQGVTLTVTAFQLNRATSAN